MPLFTLEVSKRPVLVFAEEGRDAAAELVASSIGPDLLDFEEEEGRPVWDGEEELSVREATPEEAARWEQGRAEAQQDADAADGDEGEGPDGFAVFLIEVVDASAEED